MEEYMIGSASVAPAFSKLTLAALEDSGWYKADYTQADVLYWGLNQGCDFALKTCNNWPSSYYCAPQQLSKYLDYIIMFIF
jgi:leishmanolysin